MVYIASVRIQVFDGVMRVIIDVRHVPDLWRSLPFVKTSNRLGLKIIVENDTLKVT